MFAYPVHTCIGVTPESVSMRTPPESHLRQHDRIRATLKPQRTDDLKSAVLPFIGQNREWSVAWMIEEHNGGHYVGQWAIGLELATDEPAPGFTWVPECDLVDIEILDRLHTEDEHRPTPPEYIEWLSKPMPPIVTDN